MNLCDEYKQVDDRKMEDEKYSDLWNRCWYDGEEVLWMTSNGIWDEFEDIDGKTSDSKHDKLGKVKLQKKKEGLPWSLSNTEKFRIIYRRKEEDKWKTMEHSNDEQKMNAMYDDYIKMLQWKNQK